MRIFTGLTKTDYQDVFRTIGLYCDEHKLTNVRIMETESGIILQGTPVREDSREGQEVAPQTYLLTMADIEEMMHRSYARRGLTPEFVRLKG